jgi:hypothetical protein
MEKQKSFRGEKMNQRRERKNNKIRKRDVWES